MKKHPSKSKAKEMLKNPPHGHDLTPAQEHYFQALAHGWIPKKQTGGKVSNWEIIEDEELPIAQDGKKVKSFQDYLNKTEGKSTIPTPIGGGYYSDPFEGEFNPNYNIENSKLAYQNIKKQDQLDELNKQVKDFLKQNPIPKTKEAQINYVKKLSPELIQGIKQSDLNDEFIPAFRNYDIHVSDKAIQNPLNKDYWSAENFKNIVQGTPERFRLAPNLKSDIENYINPGVILGNMAKGLGEIPSNIKEGDYTQATLNMASPLIMGAIAGIGANNTRQFVNNLFNPLAGFKPINNNLTDAVNIGKNLGNVNNAERVVYNLGSDADYARFLQNNPEIPTQQISNITTPINNRDIRSFNLERVLNDVQPTRTELNSIYNLERNINEPTLRDINIPSYIRRNKDLDLNRFKNLTYDELVLENPSLAAKLKEHFINFKTNLKNVSEKTKKKILEANKNLGQIIDPAIEIDKTKFEKDLQENLNKGVGIKKGDTKIKLEETNTPYHYKVMIQPPGAEDFMPSGRIDFQPKTTERTFTDILLNKNKYSGLTKPYDFPLENLKKKPEFNLNLPEYKGISAEIGEATKQALKNQSSKLDLLSSIGHTPSGGTRYLTEFLNNRKIPIDASLNPEWLEQATQLKKSLKGAPISKEEVKKILAGEHYGTPSEETFIWGSPLFPKKVQFKYKNGGQYLTVDGEAHRVYRNAEGDIIVNHPKEDKGKWDTINLTEKADAQTIADGVASVRKWHREHPYNKYSNGGDTSKDWIDPTDAALIKVMMERNKDKNFVQRAFNYGSSPTLQTNTLKGYENEPNNERSSHLMGYDTLPSGEGMVYPSIVQLPNKNLQYFSDPDEAWNYANKTGEFIKTPSWHLADVMSDKGYKLATGIPTYTDGGSFILYQDGGMYDNKKVIIPKIKNSDLNNYLSGYYTDYGLSKDLGLYLSHPKSPVSLNAGLWAEPESFLNKASITPYGGINYSINNKNMIGLTGMPGYYGLNYSLEFEKGGLIKRADGSYSKRGLWDNIRANIGSGKKPTKEMLKQKRKIKAAESKKRGGKVETTPFGQWEYPGEITRIPSNQITMQGVPYPVLGVSNIGDTQFMQPGLDYSYQGDYVTEYPMMEFGGSTSSWEIIYDDDIEEMKHGGRTPAWQRKEGKSPSGGLNAKGRASLKREGHDIKPPQPQGGPRKKSFCARSAGQMKMWPKAAKDPNSRLRLARKKWKC